MQLGVVTRVVGAGTVVAALAVGAAQVLPGSTGEGGVAVTGRSPAPAVGAELPSDRLLPGAALAPEPAQGRHPQRREEPAAVGARPVTSPPAPQAVSASLRPRGSSSFEAAGDGELGQRQDVADEGDPFTPEMAARARSAVREVLVGGITEVEWEGDSYEVEFDSAGEDVEVAFDLAFLVLPGEADEDDPVPTAAQVGQAEAAARALAALGDVIEVEQEDDGYEVEFSRPDGTVLEVRLDHDLGLVAIEVESD